ncbi:MAG: VWA domain-containing protein [Actinomycetes bacterium]
MSPDVGELNESAIDEGMQGDPDATMALLADLTAATDPKLRELAKRLAGQLMLDVAQRTPLRRRGLGKLVTAKYRDGGDIDLDASTDAIRGTQNAREIHIEEMRVRTWEKRDTALCLLVDRSGSMGGAPLATSAVAAAAVATREPTDYSVLAFSRDVVVAKSQDVYKAGSEVVNSVLTLRGFGTTDIAQALEAAQAQLSRSRAARKIVVLLSDCRSNEPGDIDAAARTIEELVVIAPADDDVEARAFALRVGARITSVNGPTDIPGALAQVLDR